MTVRSTTLTYPRDGLGAPKDRHPGPPPELGLPAGTEVFSADNHISLADDIFFEAFPDHLKDQAPRVMNVDGGWVIGMNGQSILPPAFVEVLTQYDPLPGSHSGDVEARLAALDWEGVSKELAFPNSILALFGWPDRAIRERCFRIYNEHIADVQERSNGRIYGVGLISWWDAAGARRTLEELKGLGLTTFLMPLSPGKDEEKRPIDFASTAMDPVWEVIEESGIPVSHHIGESPPATPNEFNALASGMLQSVAPFRDLFGKYVFGGILDRHPGLRVGWFEGGINWVPSTIQDAQHIGASFQHLSNLEVQHDPQHYWEHHMVASFMVDPLGLDLIDRIGAERVMWSTDFPHNESTYGYSGESLASVVAAVGPDAAVDIIGGNVQRYLGVAYVSDTELQHDDPDWIRYEKDTATRIATLTLNRPDHLNAPTIAMRLRYADLLHQANIDDDVKVLVIRGEGDDFGTGQDLPEFMEAVRSPDGLLREFGLEDADVTYPPNRNFRHGATATQWFTDPRGGCRTLQEFKKISIVEAKGYVYGWHFYQAGDADLVISSDDALFGHAAFRYAGAAPRMWWWAQSMGLRKFQEMVFTGRPFTADEMADCGFVNSVVPRDQLEAEVQKYALACTQNRPTDVIFIQKTFFEIMKQSQNEYMGSLISAMLESLATYGKPDAREADSDTNAAIDKGLTKAVKDFDNRFPPEWRLSKKGRQQQADG